MGSGGGGDDGVRKRRKSPFDFRNARLDYDTKRASREGGTWSLILVYDIQGRLNRGSESVDLL